MKILFLFFIILVILQWFFKMKQTKVLHTHYNKFLETGNVLVERKKGIFSGAIIMLQLDKEANIKDCLLMSGATFFSSWDNCEELINENLLSINVENFNSYKKPVRKVITKAVESYQKSKDKEKELQEKPV
ncbi:transcriptional regulator GutM [Oceanobacillus jeddahense]|uniref:Transcriptional regulator GutM n=1 Tax=Oceanobacillus jeddahense TaxID=1462527 RepID=A0ABY5JPL1_9BACI|nr:transcriptional regulator GutM [Oceanobacillus jeddahense]UUI01759.1 transcriptional regulator GutM [Oceanobacillus jeddahense]